MDAGRCAAASVDLSSEQLFGVPAGVPANGVKGRKGTFRYVGSTGETAGRQPIYLRGLVCSISPGLFPISVTLVDAVPRED